MSVWTLAHAAVKSDPQRTVGLHGPVAGFSLRKAEFSIRHFCVANGGVAALHAEFHSYWR